MHWLVKKLLNLDKNKKILIVILVDIFLFYLSLVTSIYLSGYTITIQSLENNSLFFLPMLLFIPIFYFTGLYSSLFRFVDTSVIRKSFISVFIFFIISFGVKSLGILENYIVNNAIIIHSIIFFIMIVLSRLFFANVYLFFSKINKTNIKTFIYGAGEAGISINQRLSNYKILGYIDDDKIKIGKSLNGIKIYSYEQSLIEIDSKKIENIFVAISNISKFKKNQILEKYNDKNITIKFIPNIIEIISDKIPLQDFQTFNVNSIVSNQIKWSYDKIEKLIFDKIILITGAGGSIGSEIVKLIINFKPKKIILIDNSEYNLFNIKNYIDENFQNTAIFFDYRLNDIKDHNTLNLIFEKHKPHFVFHAAAYKHVNLSMNNPISFIENNIFGTLNLVKCSLKHKCQKFLLISTDKAVRPINIMGLTKRFAELIVLGHNNKEDNETLFSVVRFGNVLDSRGSVIPIFRQQIKSGGPVTVTDPRVERYMMLLSDAVGLVLSTIAISKGGDVFVLNMGKPIKINDIAKNMIKFSGLNINNKENSNDNIKIVYTGLKEGEKITEDLFISDNKSKTYNPDIFQSIEKNVDYYSLNSMLRDVDKQLNSKNINNTIHLLKNIIDNFDNNLKI